MKTHRILPETSSRPSAPARWTGPRPACILIAAAVPAFCGLHAATFTELYPAGVSQSSAAGISPDGLTVVGQYRAAGVSSQAFRWTAAGGFELLPDLPGGNVEGEPRGVSEDGLVVVGRSSGTDGLEAVQWSPAGEISRLGVLAPNRFVSHANAVSWDGAIIVGQARSDLGDQAFRWTGANGMVALGDLRGPGQFQRNSEAHAVSWDGSVLAGTAQSSSGNEAFLWTEANGMVGLGDLPGSTFSSEGYGISADGTTVVGRSRSDISGTFEAFRWTAANGMVGLGDLPGGIEASEAYAVSGDGSIVVGRGRTDAVGTYEAFLWDQAGGMRNLREELIAKHGLADQLNGWILTEARAISPDGRTIVGNGAHAGRSKAWVVQLDPPAPDLSIIPVMPVVELDKLVYDPGDSIHVLVRFKTVEEAAASHRDIVLSSPDTGDVEFLKLDPSPDPMVLQTTLSVQLVDSTGTPPVPDDDSLSAAPNEIFVAMYGYELPAGTENPGAPWMAADFGIVYDSDFAASPVSIEPGIVMTEDENDPPPGMRPIGTLLINGGASPGQVAREEVLYQAENDAELARFLAVSGGTLIEDDRLDINDVISWRRIAVTPDPGKIRFLDQLRALVGDPEELVASNEGSLALYASALEWWLQGFKVALNQRFHLFGRVRQLEGSIDGTPVDYFSEMSRVVPSVWDPIFGVQKTWAFMEMFDFTSPASDIPVAFIDQGFAPNPDFRGYPTLFEVDMATGRSGPGAATGRPTVSNSFFGDKSWHGTGVVSAAGAVPGNFYGVAGTGGHVVRPMLYKMGLREYAFGMGLAIRRAVNDGAAIVNISAGLPCRILWVLGPDDICTSAGRNAFFTKITAVVTAAARAACSAAAAILPFGGRILCRVTIAHFVGRADPETIRVLLESVFVGGLRGPVEEAVAFATSRGIPIVANAGNRIDDDDLGFLDRFINNENYNIDDWQVIPAVLPDVICAGAATAFGWDRLNDENNNFYRNVHFWGEAVDLWAPIPTAYFAPESVDVDPADVPVRDHVFQTLGGTSAAAPFITGVLANMMAVNPALNPLRVPPAARPAIPRTLRDLIVGAAHLAGDPDVPASPAGLSLIDPDTGAAIPPDEWHNDLFRNLDRRRNLIDCFNAIQAAGAGVIPDYAALGYQTDYGLIDDVRDLYAAGVIDGVVDTVTGRMERDEIGKGDQDSWRFEYGTEATGVFQSHLRLFIPASEDPSTVRINGRLVPLVATTADEHTLEWLAPPLFSGGAFPVEIRADGGNDFLYRLEVNPATVSPAPIPDSYDASSSPGLGDSDLHPVPVGEGTDCPWEEVPAGELEGGLEASAWQICKEDLNFHIGADEDWFELRLPTEWEPFDCLSFCRPRLRIEIVPLSSLAEIEVRGSDHALIARGSGSRPLELRCDQYFRRFPLLVGVRNIGRSPLEYALKFRWSVPDSDFCARAERLRDAHVGSDPGGLGWREPIDPEAPFIRGSGLVPPRFVNPPLGVVYPVDAFGRILRAQLFLIRVHTAGALELQAALRPGASLRMELFDLQENLLGSSLTPDFVDPQVPYPMPLDRLALAAQNVPAGTYLLAVSGYRPGDALDLLLTRNAIHDGSPALEDYAAPDPNATLPVALPLPLPDLPIPELVPQLQVDDPPFGIYSLPACFLEIEAQPGRAYQAELKIGADWIPYGYPAGDGLAQGPYPMPLDAALIPGANAVRVRELGGPVVPHTEEPGLEFQVPTARGARFGIERSPALTQWNDAIDVFGDGTVLRKRFRLDQDREFFRAWRSDL